MKQKTIMILALLLTAVSGAWAVDVIEEGVGYYILHVESGLFLGGQNSYGTQGTLSTDAGIFQFQPGTTGVGYNIVNTLVTASDKNLGFNLYCDNYGKMTVKDDEQAHTTKIVDGIWSIVDQGGGIFAFHCDSQWSYNYWDETWVETKHGYLCKSETKGARKGYTLAFSEELTDDCLFYVLTLEEAMAYAAAQAESGSVSYNFLIKNPDFCRNQTTAGWTVSADCTNKNLATGDNGNYCAESNKSPFTISQVAKDLPAGQYQLTAQAFYSGEGDGEIPYLFAGENKANFPANNGETSTTTASNSFKAGKYQIAPITFVLKEKTDLEVGFHSSTNQYWCVFDNIELTYTGPLPTYSVTVKSGTEDAANWSATPNPAEEGQTVTLKYSGTKKVKSITVKEKAADFVDLGLSVKWAKMNVGAATEGDYGQFFAWGETTGYSSVYANPMTDHNFGWASYSLCNGSNSTLTKYNNSASYGTVDNKVTLEAADDAATAIMGSPWRMPTGAEWEELIATKDNTAQYTWEWTTANGHNGYRITRKSNGANIFLPAAGSRYGTSLYEQGTDGYYWSSSLDESDARYARNYYLIEDEAGSSEDLRGSGLSVRAVQDAE